MFLFVFVFFVFFSLVVVFLSFFVCVCFVVVFYCFFFVFVLFCFIVLFFLADALHRRSKFIFIIIYCKRICCNDLYIKVFKFSSFQQVPLVHFFLKFHNIVMKHK